MLKEFNFQLFTLYGFYESKNSFRGGQSTYSISHYRNSTTVLAKSSMHDTMLLCSG